MEVSVWDLSFANFGSGAFNLELCLKQIVWLGTLHLRAGVRKLQFGNFRNAMSLGTFLSGDVTLDLFFCLLCLGKGRWGSPVCVFSLGHFLWELSLSNSRLGSLLGSVRVGAFDWDSGLSLTYFGLGT